MVESGSIKLVKEDLMIGADAGLICHTYRAKCAGLQCKLAEIAYVSIYRVIRNRQSELAFRNDYVESVVHSE